MQSKTGKSSLADDIDILRHDFEAALGYCRDPDAIICLGHLIKTIADVPADILRAYTELFDGLQDSEMLQQLIEYVRGGRCIARNATEFVGRFISKATAG